MASLLSRQPWKGLLPSTRPLPEWSLRMSVIRDLVLQLHEYNVATLSNDMASVQADHERFPDRFALAAPADLHLYTGVLRPDAATQPAAVGGLWYPSPPPAGAFADDEKIALHVPGGAFVLAFGQDMHGRDVAGAMARHLGVSRTFVAQYRLSSAGGEDTRFPAALQDILTVYRYVLSLGVRPQNVLLSGDSAGGQPGTRAAAPPGGDRRAAAAAARRRAALVALGARHGQRGRRVRGEPARGDRQYAVQPAAVGCRGLPAGGGQTPVADEQLPYISPLHHPFRTCVPLFIHAGGAEVFYDDVRAFAGQMAAVDGNRVRFAETAIAGHDLIMSYAGLGLEAELEVAMSDARDLLSGET
ncbi:uncharacterized protein PG998_002842 [Apiospora kogelbergensis]|uniref:uncharacterized protein n=1 Tax=Apiospora kogelbergensis TaxID=1337665 RepID=UPI0031304E1B